ncbi:MAG: DUF2335 domain-containing protein [Rikenellaceae bacterium]|jgi:uncharacterized membrane protein|nr:DUF2335 domain-containing protein [Rikenellaceae bacterium]
MTDITKESGVNGCEIPEDAVEKLVEKAAVEIVEDKTLDSKTKAVEILSMYHESFSGPMPSPRMMADYEKVLPGAAERIIAMTEEQQRHRIALEKVVIPKQVKQSGRGQVFAFSICILMLLFAGYCVSAGAEWTAVITIVLALVSVVGLFITGKYKIKKDLEDKE